MSKDVLVALLRRARGLASGGVVHVTLTQTLGAKVKGIAEGLVDALQRITASHEDLSPSQSSESVKTAEGFLQIHTRSKAVEHARGCVAQKMGRGAMFMLGNHQHYWDRE